jgi:hypothetical protein
MTAPDASTAPQHCPRCNNPLPAPLVESGPATSRWLHYPFCSDRCRLLDLGKWLAGEYVIPGDPTDPASQE